MANDHDIYTCGCEKCEAGYAMRHNQTGTNEKSRLEKITSLLHEAQRRNIELEKNLEKVKQLLRFEESRVFCLDNENVKLVANLNKTLELCKSDGEDLFRVAKELTETRVMCAKLADALAAEVAYLRGKVNGSSIQALDAYEAYTKKKDNK